LAEDFFNTVFLTQKLEGDFSPVPIGSRKSLPDLISEISDNILQRIDIQNPARSTDEGDTQNYNYAIFFGWEPHITKVKKQIEDAGIDCVIRDQSDFILYSEPFFHITVDCIIKSEKLQEYKNNEQFKQFLVTIKESIQKLNELKSYGGAHYKIRRLAGRLLLEDSPDKVHHVLHKINFQFNSDNF
jgi:hypothetical protein